MKSTIRSISPGIAGGLCIAITAFQPLIVESVEKSTNWYIVGLATLVPVFLICLGVAVALDGASFLRRAWRCRSQVVWANVWTATLWTCYFYSVSVLFASEYMLLSFGVLALRGSTSERNPNKTQTLCIALLVILLVVSTFEILHDYSLQRFAATIAALASGLAAFKYIRLSHELHFEHGKTNAMSGLSSVELVALRFPIQLFVCVAVSASMSETSIVSDVVDGLIVDLQKLLGLFSTILALLLFQNWVRASDAKSVAVLFFTAPAITACFQLVFGLTDWRIPTSCIAGSTLMVIYHLASTMSKSDAASGC